MFSGERSRSDGSYDVAGMPGGDWSSTSIPNLFSQGRLIHVNDYCCSLLEYSDLLIDKQTQPPFFLQYLKIITEILP